eukprot:CAMPEP_0172330380 /NCGR_PEP_ID=MMETSP1058-20130122/61370_1 /TAXON_ID=83371 /ORGANISM="Detonula confervacea, Strain CCMP 353" /LENGTH=343 /DNA_ID=CAMNT_0013047591 /DNA_START=180 /DNA_END=1211 /DNA_ORIENTATION=+
MERNASGSSTDLRQPYTRRVCNAISQKIKDDQETDFRACLKDAIGYDEGDKIHLRPPQPEIASRAIDAAKMRTCDPLKDWTPPQREECPICFLPLPLDGAEISNRICCGKRICNGCTWGSLKANHNGLGWRKLSHQELAKIETILSTCPFCRTLDNSLTDSDGVSRVKKRAESGIAEDIFRVSSWYNYGEEGFKQDTAEALIWCRRAADAGSSQAMGSLGISYLEGDGLGKDIAQGMQYLQKSAEHGQVLTFWLIAYKNWKRGEIEDAILNFRKGAVCGSDKCLEQMLPLFKRGFITKEEYLFTLRAYQTVSNEMKSKAREDSIVFLGRQGHTLLEGAQRLSG